MSINNINELNSLHMDVLKEIGNIGSGNSATSLSAFLGKKVNIDIPTVKMMDINDMADHLGGPENMVASCTIIFNGDINGIMLILLSDKLVANIVNYFFPSDEEVNVMKLNDMQISLLNELSNIAIASYINAISEMTSLSAVISTPSICVDMVGAILNLPFVSFDHMSEKIISIAQNFRIGENTIDSNILMIPDIESLNKILNSLGIE